jgi:hypothetical protein
LSRKNHAFWNPNAFVFGFVYRIAATPIVPVEAPPTNC